jgi:regulator of vacuolar morphogenesis
MAPPLEISIPTTTISTPTSSPPYALYNITLRLPLRTFIVQKRYSEFVALDTALKTQLPTPPPIPLPSKSWPLPFMRTSTNPTLVEERRASLETYLRAIAETPDSQWRATSVWRTFLNLPSSAASQSSSRSAEAHADITGISDLKGGGANLDPAAWLDVLREMKARLHEARLWLGKRDGATTSQAQHEASASAKKCLVKAGLLVQTLEDGLKALAGARGLGEGELRRRRDLVNSAKVEKEGLEKLAASLALKGNTGSLSAGGGSSVAASSADRTELFGGGASRPKGRVLGAPAQETERTRELGNEGVLQLQKQMMQEQDMDLDELAKIVRRQKEMGIAISDELDLQNEMLTRVDEDVTRVGGKLEIAKKRTGKIR